MHLAMSYVVAQGNVSVADDAVTSTNKKVKLAKQPRDLHTLWKEYQFGLNGHKPAKDYTASERGANKWNYCRRKRFWSVVELMIKQGETFDSAIDRIYAAYGKNMSVTKILNALGNDSRDGVHRFG